VRISNLRILRFFGFRPMSPYASVEQPLSFWLWCLAWRLSNYYRAEPDRIIFHAAIVFLPIAYYVVECSLCPMISAFC
jgi:hypothetical protein